MIRDTATLTTPRLTLRPLAPSDAPAIAQGVGNYDVAKWLAVVPFPYTLRDAEAFIASPEAQARRAWAICARGRLCGIVSFSEDLGYWLARDAWGRGYGLEAAQAAVNAAFLDPTRQRLGVSHMVGNDRSERVIRALGFRRTGTSMKPFRALGQEAEAAEYEMSRRDWRALRRAAQTVSATP